MGACSWHLLGEGFGMEVPHPKSCTAISRSACTAQETRLQAQPSSSLNPAVALPRKALKYFCRTVFKLKPLLSSFFLGKKSPAWAFCFAVDAHSDGGMR